MAAASLSRVSYYIKLGDHVGPEEAADMMKAFDEKSQGQGSMCTYLGGDNAMLLECNSRTADESLATLTEIIDNRGAIQIECSELEEDDFLDDEYDDFMVDAPMMAWEEIDESDDQDIIEPSEGSIETWQPSNAQTDLLSLLKRNGEDLTDEIAKLTGCILHLIPEQHQVYIEGDDREMAKRGRKMLEALERHFLLLGQSVAAYILEVEAAPDTQLRFSAINAVRNKVMQNSIIDHNLRFESDLYVLRILRQEQETGPEFDWIKTSARDLAPFLRVTDRETRSLSKLWKGFCYTGKGEKVQKTVGGVNGTAPLSVNGNKGEEIQSTGKGGLQNGDHAESSGLPSNSGKRTDQLDSGVTVSDTRARPQAANPEEPARKQVRKARRPIVLGSQQGNKADTSPSDAKILELESRNSTTFESKSGNKQSSKQSGNLDKNERSASILAQLENQKERPAYIPPHLRGLKEKPAYVPPHLRVEQNDSGYVPPHLRVEEKDPSNVPPHLRDSEVDLLLGNFQTTGSLIPIPESSQNASPRPTQPSQQASYFDLFQGDETLPELDNLPSLMPAAPKLPVASTQNGTAVSAAVEDVDHPQAEHENSVAASLEPEKAIEEGQILNEVSLARNQEPMETFMEIPDAWIQEQLQSSGTLELASSIRIPKEDAKKPAQEGILKVEGGPHTMEDLIQDWDNATEEPSQQEETDISAEVSEAVTALLIPSTDEARQEPTEEKIETSEEDTEVRQDMIRTPDETSDESLEVTYKTGETPDAPTHEMTAQAPPESGISKHDDVPEAKTQEVNQAPDNDLKEAAYEGAQDPEEFFQEIAQEYLQESQKLEEIPEARTSKLLGSEKLPRALTQDQTKPSKELEKGVKKADEALKVAKQGKVQVSEEIPVQGGVRKPEAALEAAEQGKVHDSEEVLVQEGEQRPEEAREVIDAAIQGERLISKETLDSLMQVDMQAPKEAAEASIRENLQISDEVDSREYKKTMGQQKSTNGVEASEVKVGNAEKIYRAVSAMLELARSHRGQVEFRVELGKILVGGLSKPQRPFSPEEWDSLFVAPNKMKPTFTEMLTTSPTDTDSILDMKTADGRRFFKALPETKKVIYEIECSGSNGEEIMIQVDGTSFEYQIRKGSRMFGSVFVFFPERSWDARIRLEGMTQTGQLADAVKELIDNLYIAPDQTNISISTKAPDLRIRSVVSKLRTQHLVLPYQHRRRERQQSTASAASASTSSSSIPQSQIVLQITETRDLILQNHPTNKGTLRAFSTPPAQMIADAEGSRLWYEVDLIPLAAEQTLKENIDLPLAEEASWTPDTVVDEGLMTTLYGLTKDVLEGMDDVGRVLKRRLGDKEREMLEREREKEREAKLEEEGKLIDVGDDDGDKKEVDFW